MMFKTNVTRIIPKYSTAQVASGAKIGALGFVALGFTGTTAWIGSELVKAMRTGDIDLGEAALFAGIGSAFVTAFAVQALAENLKSARRK